MINTICLELGMSNMSTTNLVFLETQHLSLSNIPCMLYIVGSYLGDNLRLFTVIHIYSIGISCYYRFVIPAPNFGHLILPFKLLMLPFFFIFAVFIVVLGICTFFLPSPSRGFLSSYI
jgi:hypothetical protein